MKVVIIGGVYALSNSAAVHGDAPVPRHPDPAESAES